MGKKHFNRIIESAVCVLLFATVMARFSLPVRADASGTCGEGLTWTLTGNRLSISGSGAMYDYTDEQMPPWYDHAADVGYVVVGEGVTRVGRLAFFNLENMANASLPSTVTSIGEMAFKNCVKLRYVNLPGALTTIDDSAFENCYVLNGIRLPLGLSRIGNFAFYRCEALTTITVPSSVTRFGSAAFGCCYSLVDAKILCPIITLPDWTFYNCGALTSLTLNDSVEQIGVSSFNQCENLEIVYYSGNASGAILTSIEDNAGGTERMKIIDTETGAGAQTDGQTASQTQSSTVHLYQTTSEGVNRTETITVSASEHATVTVTSINDQTYTINGVPATNEEVLETLMADETMAVGSNSEGTVTTGIGITSQTVSTVNAVVESSEGWTNLSDAVESALKLHTEESKPQVNVQIPGTAVSGEDLKKTATKDIELSVTTSEGTKWLIDQSGQRISDYRQKTYDLGFSVTPLEGKENKTKIESESVYKLKFNDNTDFKATVGVPLAIANARSTATLYQINGKETEAIQSVIVDDSGIAWFPVANVDSHTDYYVAVNASGVDISEAVIPQTLAKDYGMDSTLMGMDGTQYRITGRSSRWGITGGQFAIYVAIGIGTIVLVVTLAMITYNKLAKSKARYALADSEEEIDEEAMRLEIMKELLEKTDRKE